MISPGPVTPAKGKTRKLTVKASDPFSDAAVKGSPPDTPDSMGTTLVLSPYPKKAVKSNLTAASIEPPEPNVNPKSQDQDSQEDKESICYESDTQTELTEGTLVEVASTDSDVYLSEKDRLKSRKAALYVEWRDYYNHHKSFGEDVHAETLQEFTTSGLLAAGWQQNPGNFHWHKPGASKAASVARAGSRDTQEQLCLDEEIKGLQPAEEACHECKGEGNEGCHHQQEKEDHAQQEHQQRQEDHAQEEHPQSQEDHWEEQGQAWWCIRVPAQGPGQDQRQAHWEAREGLQQ